MIFNGSQVFMINWFGSNNQAHTFLPSKNKKSIPWFRIPKLNSKLIIESQENTEPAIMNHRNESTQINKNRKCYMWVNAAKCATNHKKFHLKLPNLNIDHFLNVKREYFNQKKSTTEVCGMFKVSNTRYSNLHPYDDDDEYKK